MEDVGDSFPVVQAKFSGSADGVPESVGTHEGMVYKRKDGRIRVTDNLGIDGNRVVLLEDPIRYVEDRFGASHSDVQEESQIVGVNESDLPSRYDDFSNDPDSKDIFDTIESIVDSTTISGVEEALSSIRGFLDDNEPTIISIRDVLPDLVYSTDIDTISNSCGRKSLSEEQNAPFRRLLTLGGVDHRSYHQLDKTTRLSQRENAQEEIRERFNSFWNQKSIGIGIQYSEKDDEFLLMIKDTELLDRDSGELRELDRSLTEPSKRSRGFRWFLSFFVDQVTRENGVDETDDTVYLIDDPAVYLHPEGKKNWLDTIEDLTDDAQFLYSSHSPFLIDETRPDRIRIVEDRPGDRTQVTDEIFQGDSETLEPLRHTLGIGLGDSPFVNRRKILVEGPSDYFILTGVLNYLDEHEDDTPLSAEEVTLYPVGGADEMPDAGDWMRSEEFAFVFLLDKDQKGKDVEDDIEEHGLLDERRVFFLEHERAKNSFNVEIEDMFHPKFYVDCVNEVYGREEVRETIEDSNDGPDDLSNLESISVTEADEEGWLLDGEQEYKGMKIVTKIEDAFAEQGYSDLDLDKVRVAKNVQTKLQNGDGFREENVSAFKGILGRMHGVLYD
ncbi:ATP-dependent endonuclease [Halobaculum sp. MBLA0143]